ncbi:prostasin-like [Trichoplusia ni]|uniref:Prostasin-like n=1 Tax=Trichoplusia ni TaxID=7111 RepID=A0A7E5X3Q7_TRINI|nr:prostasin-like [Trichoplusia ni]
MNTNSNNNRNMNSNNRDFTNSNANNNRHMNNNNRDFINTDYNPEQNYDPVLPNFGFTNGFNTGSNTRNPNVSFQRPIAGISQIDYDRPTHKGMDLNSRVNGNSFVYPTDNPLLNRPGVKPVYEVGQPITNKPIRNNNDVFGTGNIPGNDYGATSKPDNGYGGTESAFGNDQPEIVLGVDEEDMTERQKRRYIDLAEKMCDRYKALTIKKVVALPLLPSPDPVELNVSSCTPINVPLVIGGKVVTIKEFPHMALVGWMKTRNTGYSWKCGGSLISDRFVLTAGHCTFHDRDFDVVSGPPQAVQLGSSYLDDPSAVVIKIEEVIRHPKYKMRRSYHDVALLKLKQKVTFSDVIRPACLGEAPREGENIIATGWGRTEFGGDHSEQLRSVSIPVWNMQECREIWGTSLKLPDGPRPDSHICAGEKRGGKDTCQGDSGGPIVRASGCAWRVVGVTSVGRACGAAHTPALYATVPRAFISATVFGN